MDHILKCHEIAKTDFVQGENCYLYDSQGKRYIDFESGIWCTVLGHCHPRINRAMQTQIGRVMHLGTRYPHQLAELAAEDVLAITGFPDGKCVFLSSGSEAVEFGMWAARLVTGKPLLLTFSNAYLAAYGSGKRRRPDEWALFDWTGLSPAEQIAGLDEIPFDQIGAFVFEPGGSGSGFVKFPPVELVREIVGRVRQEGGLLMVNEVTTGMGRTGKWFGFQHYDLQPDIAAIGKGLGNGYPVSAAAMRLPVAGALEDSGFHYAQSHQNDPLGCAVAREVIATLRQEDWIERGNELGQFLLQGLEGLAEKHAVLKEARGRGLLLALEFHPHDTMTAAWAYHALLDRGFLVGYYPAGNILRFDPPATMDKEDVLHLLDGIDALIGGAGGR